MSKRSFWRLFLTLFICGVCGIFFLPTRKIRLGLDLRGGVHFELEVQGQEALEADLRDSRDRLQDRLKEKGFNAAIVMTDGLSLKVGGLPVDQKSAVEKIFENLGGYGFKSEGDIYRLTQTKAHQDYLKQDANKRALQIIENRVNQFGVAEPEITATGVEGNRIVVELPGVSEAERERIKGLLSTPGRLEQRLLAKVDRMYFKTREEALAHFNGAIPTQWELLPELETERQLRKEGKAPMPVAKGQDVPVRQWVLLEAKVGMDGADIIDAHEAPNPQTDAHEVNFTLNKKGADDFAEMTGIASGESRMMAIVLDRKIISILSCQEKIFGGAVRITGRFSKDEADDLALKLKSGAMRASMKFLEEKSMGPSLGKDSIDSGVRSAVLGFLTIVAFMVFFYRWSGLNAIVALTVNLIVMLGLMGSFRAVITLPGIAGFALTIGMAVDANILIFERIKEELHHGKSVAGAIQAGFDRVFWTIVDSHVTQLVTAIILFLAVDSGPVKGFAVTLAVGVCASLFTSIYISRFIYDWVLERHPDTKTLSVGKHTFFENTNFPFMKYKGLALAISWGIILACILAAQPWKGRESHVKLGMQFTGGIDMMVRFRGDMHAETVRAALVKGGLSDAALVDYASPAGFKDFSIKQRARKGQDAKEATLQFDRIKTVLRTLDPAAANDTRKDLNTEAALSLMDQWMKSNPLGVQGDETSLKLKYEPLAAKILDARDKLGSFSSYDQLPKDLPSVLSDQVKKEYRLGNLFILKNESFSPTISGEWAWKTLKAVGIAMLGILLYVIIRFTVSFSVGGIVALIHDVLMAVGLFTLFGFEYSVPVVASFLILIGYSMADTIVVFDRIRENSHKPEYRRAKIAKLVDDSINQTLSRTILTSCSVLFVSVCLFIWGGPALRDLSFPLVIGVITGTYSSIYIASPVVVYWEKWFPHKQEGLKQQH